ncbi:Innexin inx2-like protein [Leptotrombidium deliense]|uniref:Innexin n=1 Tax=Leptotrombidium deliense TaxID=299467 RepID=A0A443RVD3_9ACAR|nr:Innexin inx2-like protein [Leptotrombidium deliense]
MNKYFGEPIQCNTGRSNIPPMEIITYCWLEGVFSSFSATQKEGYPGVKQKYIWQRQEASRLADIVEDLRDNHIDSLTPFHKLRLLQDIADAMDSGTFFMFYYVLADTLCLLNIVAQMWFTNLFLGFGVSTLGYDWYKYKSNDTSKFNDPMIRIFPRQAKCTFHKTGSSGTLEKIDSLYLLPQNIVNEQLFLFFMNKFFFYYGFGTFSLCSRQYLYFLY